MRSLLLGVCLCLAAPLSAPAQPIPGSDAPAFQSATQAWLAGDDDLSALQAFAELANADNRAAQIFLGRLGTRPYLTNHVTDPMARADRIALLRRPGGLSGGNWMDVAAMDVPLAQAFLDNALPDARLGSIGPLLNAGEIAAATTSLPGLLAYGPDESLGVLDHLFVMPDEARILLASTLGLQVPWRDGTLMSSADPLLDRDPPELALIWRPILPSQYLEDPALQALALAHSINIASYRPLRDYCALHCADEIAACAAAGAAFLGLGAGPYPFASPSEALIPTEQYWASPRIAADTQRLFSSAAQSITEFGFGQINACFADHATALP